MCEACKKDRPLKRCYGPGLHYKGAELCRPCWKKLKAAGKAVGRI